MTGAPTLRVRPPAVAGSFYPAEPEGLARAVDDAFEGSVHLETAVAVPEALVVPHAGYVYSGPVAASAYRRLEAGRSAIRRVVLVGPSHFVPLEGVAVSSADAFATPLGAVPVDIAARSEALEMAAVQVDDAAHAREHSLEVQLPFLQHVLEGFEIVPLVVGRCSISAAREVLEALWGGPETVVLVSTDLSHYHAYGEAVSIDRRTAEAVVAADAGAIGDTAACGAVALRGLLAVAAARGLTVEQVDLRNSGDTAGDRGRVVGYGAFAVG